MTYLEAQKSLAVAWKRTTTALPAEAEQPAPYISKDGQPQGDPVDLCLPAEHASLNLLPEVRRPVLALFHELAIPWHACVGGGPSNHLLSSQVQCANALGKMVRDPERIARA